MLKNLIYIITILIVISANKAFALSSSSYLIANKAITLYDFEKAYSHYFPTNLNFSELDSYNKLITLVNLQLIDEANELAEDILKEDKLNQSAWLVILTYAKLNNHTEAFNEYKKQSNKSLKEVIDFIYFEENNTLKTNKLIARSIFEIVQAAISKDQNQNNYNFLLFYLSIATILDNDFNEANYYTAYIYQTLKYYSKAEIFYKKIKANHKLYFDSQKYIAINKSKMGLFNDGEEKLLNLIKNSKKKDELHLVLADLYRTNKNYSDAIEYYSKVISNKNNLEDDYWRIYYLRGICYERSNNWDLAEEDFLFSLDLNPSSPNVLNYLAYGWLERDKNIDLALEMLIKAYNANKDSFYILDSLAWAYYKKNQFIKAAELMEEVIDMAPGEAISLYHLADIYFAMKRKREAIFFWKQALDLAEPEDQISKDLLKKLEKHDSG